MEMAFMQQGQAGIDFFSGGGEMGERMRAIDWSRNPLGPVQNWTRSLKTAVRIMLTSRQPMFVWWGSELINLYNDAYKGIVCEKHPGALGQPAAVVWQEIWEQVGPRAEQAIYRNEGTYDEALLLIMERNGYPEETYYTFSYSPVLDDDSSVGGILCANTDETRRIIDERQLSLLRELATETVDARTIDEICTQSVACMERNPQDLPFAAIYLFDDDNKAATLKGACRFGCDHRAVPPRLFFGNDSPWPWMAAKTLRRPLLVSLPPTSFSDLPRGAWQRPPHNAVILPITPQSSAGKSGMLIVGLNPYRVFDTSYQRFLEMMAAQIASGISSVQAYEEERRRAEALAELDRAKTVFFSNVSHEFRTPLTLLLGPLNDVLAGSTDEIGKNTREQLELASRNGHRLLRLVNTLLDFSRIEAGRMEATYEALDLAAYTTDLCGMFKSAAEKAGIELIINCPQLPEPVFVDHDMWEKIVLNLMSNAFKYTLVGEIEVSLRARSDAAVLDVRDTGIGISADELPKLFNRFHRVEGANGRNHEGTGIGLALVHELAKLNHAAVSVASTPDKGSTFTVTIPFGKAHLRSDRIRTETTLKTVRSTANPFVEEALRWLPEIADPTPSSASQHDRQSPPHEKLAPLRPRVLLADDNVDMRNYMKRLLAPLYDVTAVADGQQALNALQAQVPDLILTDVMMPNVDGFALLRRLRDEARTATVPVIMLSARAGEEARIEGLHAGADDYLVKPFSARELLARVGAQLSMSQLRSEILKRERLLRVEAEKLNDVARGLTAELDLQTLLQKVTDTATQLTGARIGTFLNNPTNEPGESFQLFTIPDAAPPEFDELGRPGNIPLFEEIFRDGSAIRLNDVRENSRGGQNMPYAGFPDGRRPVRSYLGVPVVSRSGEILGALIFGHPDVGVFTERAERMVLGIAAQAAVAIDNAKLYGRAKREIDERKRIEAALRQSEERYRELIRDLPAAIYTCAADGTITLYNAAAVELWGQTPTVGHSKWCGSYRNFTPEGTPIPLSECPTAMTLKDGLPRGSIEILIERPDTSRRSALAHPRALRDSSGAIVGAINMLVDITDRKYAEAQLAATKDDLAFQVRSLTRLHQLAMEPADTREREPVSALQATLEAAVELHGADFGLVSMYNRTSGCLDNVASIGFSAATLQRLLRVTPAPDAGARGSAFFTGQRSVVFDIETDTRFEKIREGARAAGFRAAHSTPIISRAGEVVGVLSVYFVKCRIPSHREIQLADLCARHAANVIEANIARHALRDSELLYRAIGESLDYGIWTCDANGRNRYVSPSFLRLVGKTQEQWSDSGWIDALHPDDADAADAWRDCVRRGGNWDRQHRFRDAEGRYHPVLTRGVPVKNEQDEIIAWAGINLDISRLKAVEEDLRKADQRKNEFLATLAHELRNPLAPLLNGLELIKRANANPQVIDKSRQMMERQLRHMIRLIDDLLDLSRITEGKIALRKDCIDLSLVLLNAIETCRPLIEQRSQTLSIDIPSEPVTINADVTRLAQVFGNLLNNATKYTQEGGAIQIVVALKDGHVIVNVRDNGIGIPQDMLERVFDMFEQVDRSLEKIHGGLGIGLTLVKRLVLMHGGEVSAFSNGIGLGSEFTVRLPLLSTGLPKPQTPRRDKKVLHDSQQHRILIVDDNEDSASSMATMLELMGASVRIAADGIDAVETAAMFQPELVLMDICMPKMNGYDACCRIRQYPWGKNSLIVALTGRGQADDFRRSREAGFDHHLIKPVQPETIGKLLSDLTKASA